MARRTPSISIAFILVHAARRRGQEGGHVQWLVVLLAREFEVLRSILQRLHVHERRYVTIHELNMLIGDGKLYRLFFRWSSSEAKRTRRQCIRLLTRINRLTKTSMH
jgi:hypothetical protein